MTPRSSDAAAVRSARENGSDGSRETVVALLARGDTTTVQAVFDGLSDEQRRQRFHVPMPRLPAYMCRLLADVDGTRHAALVLRVGGRPVGVARYVVTGPGEAELAIAVVADQAGRGHGRRLLEELVVHARRNGVVRLRFEMLADNEPARRLLAHYSPAASTPVGKLRGTVATGRFSGRATPPRPLEESDLALAAGGRR